MHNIDILFSTGHKSLLGPSGIGFLYVRNCDIVDTLYEGGGGYDSLSSNQPELSRLKYEDGTINYLGIAGLHEALMLLEETEYSHKRMLQKCNLVEHFYSSLKNNKTFVFYVVSKQEDFSARFPIILFNIIGVFANQVEQILSKKYGIIVRSGIHCTPLAEINKNDLQFLHSMHRKSNDREIVDFFFTTTNWSGEITKNEPDKCKELQFYDLDALPENIIPYIKKTILKVKGKVFYSEFGWEK